MKKTISTICLMVSIIMLLAMPSYADSNSTYSSAFFASYDSFIYVPSGRTLEIWFDVVGKGAMNEIGVESIELKRSSDGVNWTTVKTFLPEDYPQMICENTGINCDYVSYLGAYGYYFRAYVTFYASNSRGSGYQTWYTETVYLTPPTGILPRS